jgi:hypothetical protein
MKTGTRIELFGTPAMGGFPAVAPEIAKIARWEKVSGPRIDGWHCVKFQNGSELLIHESRFRVIDNS